MEMRLGRLDLEEQKERCGFNCQSTSCSGRSGPQVNRMCLLGLGAGTNKTQQDTLEGKDLWNPQVMGAEQHGRLAQAFCYRARGEPGSGFWGNLGFEAAGVFRQPALNSCRFGLWVNKKCLLELGLG